MTRIAARRIIRNTEAFVQRTMKGDAGHDWSHVDRVRRNALVIARRERADPFVVELAALLHDVADWKFHRDEAAGGRVSRTFLAGQKLPAAVVDEVCDIVDNISWKEGRGKPLRTLAGQVVQDADRLEAIGAIGIARTFTYGGFRQRSLENSIAHFHEKIVLLKDRMNTNTGRRLALRRHRFVLAFLREFSREWNGVSHR